MKKGKGMQLSALLGAMLFIILVVVSTGSSDAINLSNDTNFSNDTIPQENETYQMNKEVEDIPKPAFREVVIVYFKEMPVSIEEFASKYSGKLVFARQEIKMAAFETKQEKKPGVTSQQTLDFIDRVSKDPLVEQSFEDEFFF